MYNPDICWLETCQINIFSYKLYLQYNRTDWNRKYWKYSSLLIFLILLTRKLSGSSFLEYGERIVQRLNLRPCLAWDIQFTTVPLNRGRTRAFVWQHCAPLKNPFFEKNIYTFFNDVNYSIIYTHFHITSFIINYLCNFLKRGHNVPKGEGAQNQAIPLNTVVSTSRDEKYRWKCF